MITIDQALGALQTGLLDASPWQILFYVVVTTHITIVAVTVYLHRAQAHRALDVHPALAHAFRFWLWLATGMSTRQWVAVHRKHHAKCETVDDPHSPVQRGLRAVLWRGTELYRVEATNAETLAKYSHGAPNDWMERHLYTPHPILGVAIMMVIDLLLFGVLGLTVWAAQMAWIPFWAAGVVNGLGHHWGYRNYEAPDASTNLLPWGIIIGGEELHNNHHTYPTSAKFAIKPYEFDLGWAYIRGLQALGLASVKKRPPRLVLGDAKAQADGETLQAVIAHRYQLMADYASALKAACAAEVGKLRAGLPAAAPSAASLHAQRSQWRLAERWAHRDRDKVPLKLRASLDDALAQMPVLQQWLVMREELRLTWTRSNASAEQLVAHLQSWCARAEGSGIAALRDMSLRLRMAQA